MVMGRNGEYMVVIDHHWAFAQDAAQVRIAKRTKEGWVPITIKLEFGELVPEGLETIEEPEPAIIGNDLLQALLSALAGHYIGTPETDLVAKVNQLEAELRKANQRLDSLISGIGRLGGGQ